MDKKLNILFYQPYNQSVIYIESLIETMAKDGHKTYYLSFAERGDTHLNVEKFGCQTYSQSIAMKIPIIYHCLRIWLLINFCKKNKIDIVYSHYQEANLIAVLAQFFTRARFVITRHHSDCGYIDYNVKEIFADKIINRLAKLYIAPSKKVYHQIITVESTNQNKVRLINYGYNFNAFSKPDSEAVNAIRKSNNAELLIVMAARFIPEKRHILFFTVIKRLVHEGYDIKAIVPGKGPEEERLKKFVVEMKLENIIYFPGFKRDIHNYFAAADIIVHISLSEASNSAIKEAGFQEKAIVVCKEVGDFDDYIINGENGYLIDNKNTKTELYSLLKVIYFEKDQLLRLGKNLKLTVIERFDIDKVYQEYVQIHVELLKVKTSKR